MIVFRKYSSRWLLRASLALAGLLVVAGIVAPFINAKPFSHSIQRALEASLGRRVSFQEVHFAIFTGPGFSLSGVTIQENRRYGLEPFAYVPTLQARLRVASLLRGRIAFSSLRLLDPSLNIVKQDDGTWNVVQLVSRLTAPSRLPLDLFPAFSVSGARLDFKLGPRKTIFYITDADLSLYPQHSGKLYIQFSGSPARSDRAGNGFGHLHGNANWFLHPATAKANQLEANISLDPSNLSELTTLVQGHDAGVQARVSSAAHVEGPINDLRISGNLTLNDVHRWDLLPASGEAWRVGYRGDADLLSRELALETVPVKENDSPPVALKLKVNDFLRNASWSMLATLNDAPAARLLPIAQRMGIAIPEELRIDGSADGAVSYARDGFSGAVEISRVSVALPNLPVLHANTLVADIDRDGVRVRPAEIQTESSGDLIVGADYSEKDHRVQVSLQAKDFPAPAFRDAASQFLGAPDVLGLIREGTLTGRFVCEVADDQQQPQWSGQFRFADGVLETAGMSHGLTDAAGQIRFSGESIDVDRLSGRLGDALLNASYHSGASGPARLRASISELDLRQAEADLQPTLQAQGIFERLGVARRRIPSWLAKRAIQADVNIGEFSIAGTVLGSLKTRLQWKGPKIQLTGFQLTMPDGELQGAGDLNVASNLPEYRLNVAMSGYRWRGGLVSAEGNLRTSGTGLDAVQNLRAEGTFSGQDVSFSTDDQFNSISGEFQFSFADGWPDLKLAKIEAADGDESWTGSASTLSDGKLVMDLEREGKQRHVISSLEDTSPVSSVLLGPRRPQ